MAAGVALLDVAFRVRPNVYVVGVPIRQLNESQVAKMFFIIKVINTVYGCISQTHSR